MQTQPHSRDIHDPIEPLLHRAGAARLHFPRGMWRKFDCNHQQYAGANRHWFGLELITSISSTYSISGVVSGISDVSVMLSGASSNKSSTDSGGNFGFAKLAPGHYTISPSKTGYGFSPVSLAETVTSASLTDANFAATASSAAT